MRKYFTILTLFILGGVAYYQYQEPIRARVEPVLAPAVQQVLTRFGIIDAPCEKPIPYVLGTFNTKFGISQGYFLEALSEAEAIWEEPFGKELFAYAGGENAEENTEKEKSDILKVNLIYDYRQDATNKLKDISATLGDNKAEYESLKARHEALLVGLSKEKSIYATRVSAFNARQKTYEKEVKYWNARGGAPEAKYNELQKEKKALDALIVQLQTLQNNINTIVAEVNALVVNINRMAGELNISVGEFNTVGASRGESFEEGVYTSDALGEQIDIYEFSNRAKLVRVLAHELGHALGIGHVPDPKAIMYELNQGNSKVLSQDDIDALNVVCGVEK